ncbi:MAG: hypothetical protein ACK559_15265, partial [bacterium]
PGQAAPRQAIGQSHSQRAVRDDGRRGHDGGIQELELDVVVVVACSLGDVVEADGGHRARHVGHGARGDRRARQGWAGCAAAEHPHDEQQQPPHAHLRTGRR